MNFCTSNPSSGSIATEADGWLGSRGFSDGNSTQDSYVTSGDYRYHLDGTGRLPQALSEMPSHNLTIALTYVPKGMWAPSEDLKTRVVLGPVASMQAEQQGSEGFVVWAFVPQG